MKKQKAYDQLHAELNAWAAWLIRNRVDRSVGWPSSSAIAQWGMKVSGGTSDTLWVPTSDDWTQFDQAVRQLGDGHYALLRVFYVDFGGHRLSDYARHCAMDKSNLRRLIELQKDRLRTFLNKSEESC